MRLIKIRTEVPCRTEHCTEKVRISPWVAFRKEEPLCKQCKKVNKMRKASADRGFRVGI